MTSAAMVHGHTNGMSRPAEGRDVDASIVERVLVAGDLARLSPQERVSYYLTVCRSVGLNPLTEPFKYIQLNGKLTLYATKNCTDQLRQNHSVSVTGTRRETTEGIHVVTAAVRTLSGRSDEDIGAVSIKGLAGENLANALMKATTKAKRRATLSICGLSFVDESEIEAIPDARHVVVDQDGVIVEGPGVVKSAPKPVDTNIFDRLCNAVDVAATANAVNKAANVAMKARRAGDITDAQLDVIKDGVTRKRALLGAPVPPAPPSDPGDHHPEDDDADPATETC